MSMSNPMHHANLGHTKRDDKWKDNPWAELQREKKAYLLRKQEEEDAEAAKRMWRETLRKQREEDDPPF